MKLILNFRDAIIKQINNPGTEYSFEFDLSKMNKPRLSHDTRMYIESLNLPEFFDEVLGPERGQYRGYFELRCNNIDAGNNYDTEYGNTNNSIIFTSPLDGIKSFRNNNPMYISNFKVNQGFLADKFVIHMKIYDHEGNPFINGYNLVTEMNQEINGDYINKLSTFSLNKKLYDETKIISDDLEPQLKAEQLNNTLLSQEYNKSYNNLVKAIDNLINTPPSGQWNLRQRIKTQQMKDLLTTGSKNTNLFSYLLDDFFVNIDNPYGKVANEINDFRTDFVNYNISLVKLEKLQKTYGEVNSGEQRVFYDVSGVFDNTTIHLKAQSKKLDYIVPVPGGTDKTGTVEIRHFNSVKEKQAFVSVYNIEPTDTTDIHKLFKSDILEIDPSKFETILPSPFEYFIVKATSKGPRKTEIKHSSIVIPPPQIEAMRYAIKIIRTGTLYDYEILERPKNFIDGAKIEIDGTLLDGTTGVNDVVIEINKVYVPPTTVPYNDIEITEADKGIIKFDITRDLTTKKYDLTTKDFTNSSNYKVGYEFVIKGDRLGGKSPDNDLDIKVADVVQKERIIKINQDESYHIVLTEITPSNSTTTSGGTNWKFKIQCQDGTYNKDFDPAIDTSSGFAANDIIKIDGKELTGISGTNDLEVKVTAVDGSGKITDLEIEPNKFKGRFSSAYEIEVKLTKDSPDYEAKYISGLNFLKGDVILVEGSQLNAGTDGVNDLTLYIKSITPDADPAKAKDVAFNKINEFDPPIGVANFDIGADGKVKRIKKLNNNPFIEVADGSFVKSDTIITGTAIDIPAQTKPTLQITLNKDPVDGLAYLNTELTTARNDLNAAKATLIPARNRYQTVFGSSQLTKMKTMNMNLVLYDEVDEYKQSSHDAIKGNTYSRLSNSQFKRI